MADPKLHSITAAAVIRRDDGRILILKRADHEKVYPGLYCCPGGKVEGNDTIAETLIREVKEECGLDLEPGFIVIKEKSILRKDGQTSKALSLLCRPQNPEALTLDKNDFSEFAWVNLEELRRLKHVGIEAEFIKADKIFTSKINMESFYLDSDKVSL